jgi:hypothetical protein
MASACALGRPASADPCGMVPPIYSGGQLPSLARIGEQKTFVFYKDGIETFVIRPGFSGKVDDFGMLIPFPTPPAIRKVPDNIFDHIAAAIDPPEVVVDLTPNRVTVLLTSSGHFYSSRAEHALLAFDSVRVIREEAVGMHEVAVLEAGSAAALQRWMDDHGYKYPTGMDKACQEYVDDGWCFVAVKTRVGRKRGVDPQPGQRAVDASLPPGSEFDGNVQAMGFRFHSKEFVVPMKLSAFNEGKLNNIVYLLTDSPKRIRSIAEEYVVRQIPGNELYRNVVSLLPLRIIGGTRADISDEHWKNLTAQRDPAPHNGLAAELFASDLLAAREKRLSHRHEESEKELLRIGEWFDLRGPEIDTLNRQAYTAERQQVVRKALEDLQSMTMTVVDGDFPRETLAKENLTFADFEMPAERNLATVYDAKLMAPAPRKSGIVLVAAPPESTSAQVGTDDSSGIVVLIVAVLTIAFLGLLVALLARGRKTKNQ